MAMIYVEVIIMAMIYKANMESIENGWDWDTTFINNAIDIVEEFDIYEDLYGVF